MTSNKIPNLHTTAVTPHAGETAPSNGADAPRPSVDGLAEELCDRLIAGLGPEKVVTDAEILKRLGRDFLQPWRGVPAFAAPPVTPLAVVRPRSTEDVRAAIRVAASSGVPLVEFGGGTGLMGGARSIRQGIVLDLRTLNRILHVSAEDRTAHVEAGMVLADLGNALEPLGLIVGHDPWTYPIATVGGTISTNGLGYTGGKYGTMGDQVLGLTVVLADGTVLRTRPAARSSTGPRLRALFAGAEGTFGVITEAVLRVFPRPEVEKLAGYRFAGFAEGHAAVRALLAAGIAPAILDFGQTYAGGRSTLAPVTPVGAPGVMFVGFHGLQTEVRALMRRTRDILERAGGERLPGKRTRRFWGDRHVDPDEIRRRQESPQEVPTWPPRGTLFDFVHIALPASRVIAFTREADKMLLERGISIGEWGLWHSPELLSATLFMPSATEAAATTFSAGLDAMLGLAQDMDGSMEYCHGAGVRLAHLMSREHGAGMAVLRGIKAALDPQYLLNPGKMGL